eukprot:6213995-Pleurochrysis_carterae.AAC.6
MRGRCRADVMVDESTPLIADCNTQQRKLVLSWHKIAFGICNCSPGVLHRNVHSINGPYLPPPHLLPRMLLKSI